MPQSKPSVIGRRVTLSDEGEGWFAGYADVSGYVESVMPSNEDNNPCYVVRLDTPLELQESGAATTSGFILRRYSHCVVHGRWKGADINVDMPVSVHMLLVLLGTQTPQNEADIAAMTVRAWARCVVRAE